MLTSRLATADAFLADAHAEILGIGEACVQRMEAILHSTSWRLTRPLRMIARIISGRPAANPMSVAGLPDLASKVNMLREIEASTSWWLTKPLRVAILKVGLRTPRRN
jgi:hypothetical protein